MFVSGCKVKADCLRVKSFPLGDTHRQITNSDITSPAGTGASSGPSRETERERGITFSPKDLG